MYKQVFKVKCNIGKDDNLSTFKKKEKIFTQMANSIKVINRMQSKENKLTTWCNRVRFMQLSMKKKTFQIHFLTHTV